MNMATTFYKNGDSYIASYLAVYCITYDFFSAYSHCTQIFSIQSFWKPSVNADNVNSRTPALVHVYMHVVPKSDHNIFLELQLHHCNLLFDYN